MTRNEHIWWRNSIRASTCVIRCQISLHMMHGFKEHPEAKYGLETMCVGLGQGGAVIWKNLQRDGKKDKKEK